MSWPGAARCPGSPSLDQMDGASAQLNADLEVTRVLSKIYAGELVQVELLMGTLAETPLPDSGSALWREAKVCHAEDLHPDSRRSMARSLR